MLPTPEELRRHAREPGLLAPTSQMRAQRGLEPPSTDEGLVGVERRAFVRAPRDGRACVFVAAAALRDPGWPLAHDRGDRNVPHLLFDWRPGGVSEDLASDAALLADSVSGPVACALCPHTGGPPTCWCRPPLPGLPLAFARAEGVDPARSVVIGAGPAHRTLANALGARYVAVA